jgi:probable HAF family extracellular repeat protein
MRATAVSGDGGTLIINVSATQRVVMRDPLNIIDVGGTPAALSQDGQTIVGSFVDASGKTQAFRWTDSGGFLALGLAGGYSEAAAKVITRDGSVVFGLAGPDGAFRSDVPFRWSEDEGARVLPIPVGTFAPFAVSDSAEVLAGTDGFHAVRWSESSGALVLPSAGGFSGGAAVDISGNGELLVGSVGNIQPERAVLWDADGRAWLLDDVLPQLGIETSGWRLTDAHAISQDGRFIAGTGIFAGTERAFLIDFGESGFSAPIPEPSAYGGAGVLALILIKFLRRRNPSGPDPSPGS